MNYLNNDDTKKAYEAPTIVYEGHVGVRAGSFEFEPTEGDSPDPVDPANLFGGN